MSTWTHVAGIVRFDYFQIEPETNEQIAAKVKGVVGDTLDFWDAEEKVREFGNSKNKVPGGSEGTIQYKVIVDPNEASIDKVVLAFWGDLRDRGKEHSEEIANWFVGFLEKWETVWCACGFRAAQMTICPENSEKIEIYVAQSKKEQGNSHKVVLGRFSLPQI